MRVPPSRSRRGLSLVETLMTFVFLTSTLLVVGLATRSMLEMLRERQAEERVAAKAHRALRRVVERLDGAVRDTLAPPLMPGLGATTLDFEQVLGWQGGGVAPGVQERFVLELEDGELDDGDDDDGDGLVDERRLVWVQDPFGPAPRRTVLARGVREYLEGESANGFDDNGNGLLDEAGLSFSVVDPDDEVLTIELTLEEIGRTGLPITKTARTSVRLRN